LVEQLDARAVLTALARVDDRFREPLVLFYLDQLSYREIARRLDLPIGTVMSRLSRGKKLLRQQLADAVPVCPRPV
jgi:RNA polymerase sigma-70 factor (ECF subfamily)